MGLSVYLCGGLRKTGVSIRDNIPFHDLIKYSLFIAENSVFLSNYEYILVSTWLNNAIGSACEWEATNYTIFASPLPILRWQTADFILHDLSVVLLDGHKYYICNDVGVFQRLIW